MKKRIVAALLLTCLLLCAAFAAVGEGIAGQDVSALEDKLAELESALAYNEENRYYYTQEEIEKYKQLAPMIRILPGIDASFFFNQRSLERQLYKYAKGELDALQILEKLNQLMQMVIQEGN